MLSLPNDSENIASIAFGHWNKTGMIGGGRYPNNQSEQYAMQNSSEYLALLEQYGLNRYGAYMNMKTIKQMGGGDFDGDTVQLARRRLQEIIARTQKVRAEQLKDFSNQNLTEDLKSIAVEFGDPHAITESDMANMLYQNAVSTYLMSQDSTGSDALSQGNWADREWVAQYGRAALDLKAMYDIDSTFAKTGIMAKWTKYADNVRYNMGKPFVHVFKNLSGALEKNDLNQLGDFSKVNFPSIYSAVTTSMLNAFHDMPLSDELIDDLSSLQNSKQGVEAMLSSDKPALQARGKYLAFNNKLMTQLLTGRAMGVSNADAEHLNVLLQAWRQAAIPGNDLKVREDDSAEVAEQKRAIKAQIGRIEFLNRFGVTQSRILDGEGYAKAGFYRNARFTGDVSEFQAAADSERDRIAVANAIATGTNPHIVSATQAA